MASAWIGLLGTMGAFLFRGLSDLSDSSDKKTR